MVRVSVELVRKRAEHHDRQLAPLQEISLHQEGIEKIEHIQDWCPKLQILLLQSNLIPKIENLNKLKDLQYLNLAINNIEKIENLDKCESLQKLDLTLNFIGELTSVSNLNNNYNLRYLYLNGNPCTDYEGYRHYTIAILPQLESLDNEDIKRSERIIALQNLPYIQEGILKQQVAYTQKRQEQKQRLEKEIKEKWKTGEMDLDDEEKCKKFWNEKTEHAPEVRIEMDRHTRSKQNKEEKKPSKKERKLFTDDGRPFNINEPKIPFRLNDEKENEYRLELQVYKYLDTSYLDIDLQPTYVRVVIKGKIFQICLPEEINICESEARRSQTTGYLTIVMPTLKNTIEPITLKTLDNVKKIKEHKNLENKHTEENKSKRQLLEIGPSKNPFDFSTYNDSAISQSAKQMREKSNFFIKAKEPPIEFVDNPEVPPLI